MISGEGSITLTGRNVEKWIFTQTNTFSGGITFAAVDRYIVRGQAQGAFGTGDVTVTQRLNSEGLRSAVLSIEAEDVMADTATVSLSGTGGNDTPGFDDFSGNSVLIRMGFDDTIGALTVNGTELPPGDYTEASGDWIDGSGTLTVTGNTTNPGSNLDITNIDYLADTPSVSLTWNSVEGRNYLVRYSTDLLDWSNSFSLTIPADLGTETVEEFDLSTVGVNAEPKVFFRVEEVTN